MGLTYFPPLLWGALAGTLTFAACGLLKRAQWAGHGPLSVAINRLLIASPWALAAGYAVVFGWFAVRRFDAMDTRMTDLASFDQVVWATLHGHFMRTSSSTHIFAASHSFLAYHFEPILVLLAPLDLMFSQASVLMVVQTTALALGAIPIGLWARKRLGSPFLAAVISLAYLLNLVVAHSADQLFHETPLAIPLIALAFYFELNRRWKLTFLFAVLAMACKEEIPFTIAGMGVYAILVQRQWRPGLGILALASGWAVLALGIVIPHFNGSSHLYYVGDFAYLGHSVRSIIVGAITHPLLVMQHLVAPRSIVFILFLVVPLGFLPLFGWRVVWLALPALLYLLLDDSPAQTDPSYWYGAPVVPFLYFATIEGIAALGRRLPPLALSAFLLTVAAISYYRLGVGPGTAGFDFRASQPDAHAAVAEAMLHEIPQKASVSATTNLMAHLSRRLDLHIFPELLVPSDVYAVDLKDWDGWHGYPANFTDYDHALPRLLRDPQNASFYWGDGLLLVIHNSHLPPLQHSLNAVFGGQLALIGYDAPSTLSPGQAATFHLRWRVLQTPTRNYTVSLQFGTEANGKLAQSDEWPWQRYYPTSEWVAGQVIDAPQTLTLPPDLPAGSYRVLVTVYSLNGNQIEPLGTAHGSGTVIEPVDVK